MTTTQQDLITLVGDRLTDSWRPAFTATPRELFILDCAMWVHDDHVKTRIDREADPQTWMNAVYSNDAIITQVDHGVPDGEAYDRVIATCSVATVPWAWVAQTRPGGVIVTPWEPPMANDHLLRIEVDQHGGVGTIVDSVEFMRLRSQRWQVIDEPDDFPDIAACTGTDLDPHAVLGNHSGLVPALRMGDCRAIFETDRNTGKEALWLLAADSWASVIDGEVRQAGARKLWDEAVAAYHWWLRHDCPARVQFHLTLTPHRQWVWLDNPTNIVTALP